MRMEAESTSGHSERDMQRWRNVQEAEMMPMASWMCSEGDKWAKAVE
jgi:hypothetical protein